MKTASLQFLERGRGLHPFSRSTLPTTKARSRLEPWAGSLNGARPHRSRFVSHIAFLALCVAILMGLATRPADADSSISFSWSPNAAAQHVTGYRFYYATHTGPPYDGKGADQGDSPIEISGSKLVLEEDEDHHKSYHFKISGLPPCATIYVAMTAFDAKGQESDFTEEHSIDVSYKLERFSAQATSLDTLRVSWDAPPAGFRDLIAGYTLYYEISSYPKPDPALQFSQSVDLAPSEFVGKKDPTTLLDGLPQGSWVHLAIAALCPSGTSTLSKVFTTQMPRAGSGPPQNPTTTPSRAIGGCVLDDKPGAALPGIGVSLGLLVIFLGSRRRERRGAKGPRRNDNTCFFA